MIDRAKTISIKIYNVRGIYYTVWFESFPLGLVKVVTARRRKKKLILTPSNKKTDCS